VLTFSFAVSLIPFSYAEETKTIFIGPTLVDCVGVGPQKCMQIREDTQSDWMNFYDNIEGFDFVEGYNYKITVEISDVTNPPADSSSKKYNLIEIIEKNSSNRHLPYKNTCAPGFAPLGQVCVLNDRCGPGAYPGKLCVMENKVQPYLRPLQQGSAGIAASDVICAEPLQLIFKYDASPACVKSESTKKLELRGWYSEKPLMPCTKEYSPVCGMDGITYGNMCTLKAEHMGIKHQGECKSMDKPVACTLEWSPVCGIDGVTYGNMCMLEGTGIELKHEGECITFTEFNLDEQYQTIQNEISVVSSEIYNGMYNGDLPLEDALLTLEDAKQKITTVKMQYDTLDDEFKTDRQIAMRFFTLGKMGFASIDSQIDIIKKQIENSLGLDSQGVFPSALEFSKTSPEIDSEKGYFVGEIANGVYWLVGSGYQTMFLTTGEGVIAIDAPQPIGEKYLSAIGEVTTEPITHMIYSHHHGDHTGAAGQIFSSNVQMIAHNQTVEVLTQENDPNRPVPSITFDESPYVLSLGDKIIELYHVGNFHSNGDLIILIPQSKVVMVVDLLRPDSAPYRAFGVTPDMDQYLETHDILINDFDFELLVSGHTNILGTKEHVKTNKQFTLDVMDNITTALSLSPSNVVEKCVELTTSEWEEQIDLGEFLPDHCQAMYDYVLGKQT